VVATASRTAGAVARGVSAEGVVVRSVVGPVPRAFFIVVAARERVVIIVFIVPVAIIFIVVSAIIVVIVIVLTFVVIVNLEVTRCLQSNRVAFKKYYEMRF
jgi:hypothetical protein